MEFSYLAPPLKQIPAAIGMARDYVDAAREFIQEPCYEYITGGSGIGVTASRNLRAFDELSVYPRVLRDINAGHTRVNVPGASLVHPVLLAPVAYHILAHPSGERETARAAGATDTCMVASTLSACTLEDIAAAGADAPRWFQLYLQPEAAVTADLVRRAENAGYRAIVVTVDAAFQIANQHALRLGFRLPPQAVAGNLKEYAEQAAPAQPTGEHRILQTIAGNTPTWAALEQLRNLTRLPLWIKGVLHPQDAVELKNFGIEGIIVSNHGGRGLDGAPASLHALPGIRAAVGEKYPLLLDGGIRSGFDVFKALAKGADAVLVGRLQMYALSVAGALGVAHMLRLLREELEVCMALAGCKYLPDIRMAKVE